MENGKMKKCDNCNEFIELSKMMLHERFCKLNMKKCTICKLPVLIEEYEDHMDEYHQEIECDFCGKKFSIAEIEKHKSKCDCQLVNCMYCEMQIPKREKKEHEYICGAKTEECEICKQFIQIKDMKAHRIKGCKPPEIVKPVVPVVQRSVVDKREKEKEKEIETKRNEIRNANTHDNNKESAMIKNGSAKIISGSIITAPKKNDVGIGNDSNIKGNRSGVDVKTTGPTYVVGNNVNNNQVNNNYNNNNNVNKNPVRVEGKKPTYSNINSVNKQKPQPTLISSQKKISSLSYKDKPAFAQGKGMKFSNGFNNNTNMNNTNNNNNNSNKNPIPIISNSKYPVRQQQQQQQQQLPPKEQHRSQQKPIQPQKPQAQGTFNSSKTSLKFTPTITKGQMNKSTLSQKLEQPQQHQQPIRKNTKTSSSKPFNIPNFDSGDYLPDDIDYKDLGFQFNKDSAYNEMSLEDRNLQEIIARSMKQK